MLAQVVAVIIFIAMFIFIVTEIVERHVVSLVCALFTVIFVFGFGMHSMTAILEMHISDKRSPFLASAV